MKTSVIRNCSSYSSRRVLLTAMGLCVLAPPVLAADSLTEALTGGKVSARLSAARAGGASTHKPIAVSRTRRGE